MRINKGKIIQVIVSTVIIIASLDFIPLINAQKNQQDIIATDFVLDVLTLYLNEEKIDETLKILKRLRATYSNNFSLSGHKLSL